MIMESETGIGRGGNYIIGGFYGWEIRLLLMIKVKYDIYIGLFKVSSTFYVKSHFWEFGQKN